MEIKFLRTLWLVGVFLTLAVGHTPCRGMDPEQMGPHETNAMVRLRGCPLLLTRKAVRRPTANVTSTVIEVMPNNATPTAGAATSGGVKPGPHQSQLGVWEGPAFCFLGALFCREWCKVLNNDFVRIGTRKEITEIPAMFGGVWCTQPVMAATECSRVSVLAPYYYKCCWLVTAFPVGWACDLLAYNCVPSTPDDLLRRYGWSEDFALTIADPYLRPFFPGCYAVTRSVEWGVVRFLMAARAKDEADSTSRRRTAVESHECQAVNPMFMSRSNGPGSSESSGDPGPEVRALPERARTLEAERLPHTPDFAPEKERLEARIHELTQQVRELEAQSGTHKPHALPGPVQPNRVRTRGNRAGTPTDDPPPYAP